MPWYKKGEEMARAAIEKGDVDAKIHLALAMLRRAQFPSLGGDRPKMKKEAKELLESAAEESYIGALTLGVMYLAKEDESHFGTDFNESLKWLKKAEGFASNPEEKKVVQSQIDQVKELLKKKPKAEEGVDEKPKPETELSPILQGSISDLDKDISSIQKDIENMKKGRGDIKTMIKKIRAAGKIAESLRNNIPADHTTLAKIVEYIEDNFGRISEANLGIMESEDFDAYLSKLDFYRESLQKWVKEKPDSKKKAPDKKPAPKKEEVEEKKEKAEEKEAPINKLKEESELSSLSDFFREIVNTIQFVGQAGSSELFPDYKKNRLTHFFDAMSDEDITTAMKTYISLKERGGTLDVIDYLKDFHVEGTQHTFEITSGHKIIIDTSKPRGKQLLFVDSETKKKAPENKPEVEEGVDEKTRLSNLKTEIQKNFPGDRVDTHFYEGNDGAIIYRKDSDIPLDVFLKGTTPVIDHLSYNNDTVDLKTLKFDKTQSIGLQLKSILKELEERAQKKKEEEKKKPKELLSASVIERIEDVTAKQLKLPNVTVSLREDHFIVSRKVGKDTFMLRFLVVPFEGKQKISAVIDDYGKSEPFALSDPSKELTEESILSYIKENKARLMTEKEITDEAIRKLNE